MNLPATKLYLFPSTPCHHPHWCSLLILLPSFYPLWVCSGFWSWAQLPSWGPSKPGGRDSHLPFQSPTQALELKALYGPEQLKHSAVEKGDHWRWLFSLLLSFRGADPTLQGCCVKDGAAFPLHLSIGPQAQRKWGAEVKNCGSWRGKYRAHTSGERHSTCNQSPAGTGSTRWIGGLCPCPYPRMQAGGWLGAPALLLGCRSQRAGLGLALSV